MKIFEQLEIWFVTGSQDLYGEDALRQVSDHTRQICRELNQSKKLPVTIRFKDVLINSDKIYQLMLEANLLENCIGLICWMHTFSPAKMWIRGLKILQKPLLHLHTQYNRDIPWSSIDMNFMNLHQSAHGDREFGFINTRMRIPRKVVVGHWQDEELLERIGAWSRVTAGWHDLQGAKFARIGDNMRNVAVTEGDKVEAEIRFGYSVNGFGVGDLVKIVDEVTDLETGHLIQEYMDLYEMDPKLQKGGDHHQSLLDAAKIEIALRTFLQEGYFKGFTDTFENLHGLNQLPGIAVQRLMAEGYGFGAEGDWKTAALVRLIKVIGHGLPGGSSFMEDYTYHFHPDGHSVLGSHMLEICESIAGEKPRCEVHPLSIGGKADPVRLIFNVNPGKAYNISIVYLGNRFRLIANEVETINLESEMPKLPVARAMWQCKPDLKTAAAAWVLAGGAHHTCYSQTVLAEHLEDFAEMADIEFMLINEQTNLSSFKKELRWNSVYFQ